MSKLVHNPSHSFVAIFQDLLKAQLVQETVVAPAAASRPVVPAIVKPPKPFKHVVCDFCDSGIHDVRLKCLSCPDFDACATCEPLIATQHPGHAFVRITDADDVSVRVALISPCQLC